MEAVNQQKKLEREKTRANQAVNTITTEEALVAVKKDGGAIYNIPEELRTAQICLEALKHDIFFQDAVPDKYKTVELYLEVVKLDDTALDYVPENLQAKVKERLKGGS